MHAASTKLRKVTAVQSCQCQCTGLSCVFPLGICQLHSTVLGEEILIKPFSLFLNQFYKLPPLSILR